MKRLMIVGLCLCALLVAAGTAQAYAIYNHVNHQVCVEDRWDQMWGSCKFIVPANGHHNGAHGASLNHIIVVWDYDKNLDCRCTQQEFDIPKSGYARIYQNVVKIYKHDNTQVDSRSVTECDCGPGSGGPAKQCK